MPEARQLSYEKVALKVDGVRAEVSDTFDLPPGLARTWIEQMTILLIVDACRAAIGAHFFPTEIHVTNELVLGEELNEIVSGETIVKTNSSRLAVVFPTDLLALPMPSSKEHHARDGVGPRLLSGTSSGILALLDSSLTNRPFTLETCAEYADISPRSLQRQLKAEGVTFFQLVDRWRFRRALQKLADPKLPLAEIARSLGYSDAPYFVRAFKRWTETTPHLYRQLLP
jgi:AraC-like DNA-binding protein